MSAHDSLAGGAHGRHEGHDHPGAAHAHGAHGHDHAGHDDDHGGHDDHHVEPPPPEPESPAWLPLLGGGLFILGLVVYLLMQSNPSAPSPAGATGEKPVAGAAAAKGAPDAAPPSGGVPRPAMADRPNRPMPAQAPAGH
ncbi:MAG TPA: hypothetical protein VFQ61_23900 [Polyangiaceae bacterium]|nr:hypothetical protein [Polyangiaceae bacterium]